MSSLRLALKQSLSEAPSTKSSKNKKKNKFIYTPTPFGLSDKELRRLEKQRKADDKAKDHLSSKEDDDDGDGEGDGGVEKRLKKKIQRRKEKERLKKKLKEERKLKVCSFDIYYCYCIIRFCMGVLRESVYYFIGG